MGRRLAKNQVFLPLDVYPRTNSWSESKETTFAYLFILCFHTESEISGGEIYGSFVGCVFQEAQTMGQRRRREEYILYRTTITITVRVRTARGVHLSSSIQQFGISECIYLSWSLLRLK